MKTTNVLFLTTVLPRQKRCGGEVASQAFIDGLRQNGCQVSVGGYARKNDNFKPEPGELLVGERHIETSKAKANAILWVGLSMLIGLPYSAAKYYSQAYIKLVQSLLTSNQYDVIIIDHSQLGWLAKLIRSKSKSKIIFIAHNVEHEIYLSHFKSSNNPLAKWLYAREARLIEKLESALSKEAAEVWTLTKRDADYFSRLKGEKNVKVLALPPSPQKTLEKVIDKKFDIGLIGNWAWKFNADGLQWFFQFVYPKLSERLSIHVAGKGAEWLREKYPNVKYEGFVPNAQNFMAQARVLALPILGGSGIQIKTLDALASGSAIVATPHSMRGISFASSMVKIAEQPADFADLLSTEVYDCDSQKIGHAVRTTSEWLQTRREQFLDDIASSVGYIPNTTNEIDAYEQSLK